MFDVNGNGNGNDVNFDINGNANNTCTKSISHELHNMEEVIVQETLSYPNIHTISIKGKPFITFLVTETAYIRNRHSEPYPFDTRPRRYHMGHSEYEVHTVKQISDGSFVNVTRSAIHTSKEHHGMPVMANTVQDTISALPPSHGVVSLIKRFIMVSKGDDSDRFIDEICIYIRDAIHMSKIRAADLICSAIIG